jgi:zinc protease
MRITRLLIAQACMALLCLVVYTGKAQYEPDKNLPLDPDVKVGKLSNGLTYYIRKNAIPAKKIQLRLVVNTGSVLEDADQQGLAHFMEHMNFNGLKHFPKNELVNYLQSIGVQFGADLNAYTSFDETVYFLPIPADDPEKVEKGFTILEDWAFNALLDPEEVNKERGVVLEESRLGKGAGERMRNKYFPVLFNGSRYADRLPIGKDSILQNFNPAVLTRFYKTWYRPDLMAVIVIGDIDVAEAEKKIIAHFGSYKNPAGEKTRQVINIAPRTANQSMVLTDKEQPYATLQIFNYVERSTSPTNWGEYRKTIVEGLFNSMINQRLAEIAQQPNAPFINAGTSFGSFIRGYRAFISTAVLGDKPAKNALETITGVTESVKKYGFLATELQRAKINTLNATERAYNDRDKTESIRMMDAYQNVFLTNAPMMGVTNRYNYLKEVLPTITVEEVNALAKQTESKQGFFALLMGAEKNAASLPSNTQLTDWVAAAKALPVKAYEEKALASTLMEKAPTPGKITAEKTNTALGTTDLTLSNGITVTLKPTDFKNDEIHMDAWRQGGSRNYPLADKMNAENAAVLVGRVMGVKDLSVTDLRKFLSGKVASVTPYMNQTDEGIEGSSSVKDLETFLQLVYLYFTQPRKDAGAFQSFVTSQKGIYQNLKANPNAFFSDTLTKTMYSGNPWATGLPTAESFDQLNLDRAMEIYKNVFSNAYGLHFTFVGNVDAAKMKPLLETYLGSLPSKQKENKFTDVGIRPVKGVVNLTVNRGAAKQSRVNVIFTGEAQYSKDEELKLKMLADVLNIRIIEKLREEMGGIYGGGIGTALAKRPYGNYQITASFPCGPENVDKLVAALFGIINDAKEKGIDQKDLDKVKETLRKQHDDRIKENDYWLDELSRSFIESYDPAWLLSYTAKVNAVTTAELQQIAKKYFNTSNYVKAVLNPE